DIHGTPSQPRPHRRGAIPQQKAETDTCGAGTCGKDYSIPPRARQALKEQPMATGWAREGAVQEQIDATVKDAVERAKSHLPRGPRLMHCAAWGEETPEARRSALRGVRLCTPCQKIADRAQPAATSGYNRRGSKDSQLR